jgi:hypothetical protein
MAVCGGEVAKSIPFDAGRHQELASWQARRTVTAASSMQSCCSSSRAACGGTVANRSRLMAGRHQELASNTACARRWPVILGWRIGLRALGGRARLARRMPRRHDGHILDSKMSRRRRSDSSKATNPTTSSTPARPTLGRQMTRRWRGETRRSTSPSTTSNTSTTAWDPPWDVKRLRAGAARAAAQRAHRRLQPPRRRRDPPWDVERLGAGAARPAPQRAHRRLRRRRDPPWDVERQRSALASDHGPAR